MKNFFLVPTDFSEAAENALRYAVNTAEKSGAKIYLLHLCEPSEDRDKARLELEKQFRKIGETSVIIEPFIRVGDFKDIPGIGKELAAEIIFLGTHGANGMQKILGSNALKIVTKSEIPFIIVQKDSPLPKGYRKIIVPTSFHYENKQKISAVAEISKHFDSKICFIYSTVDSLIKEKSLQNLKGMRLFLDKKKVNYEIEKSENKDFNADTLSVATKVGAELIAIMNMQKDDILGTGLLGKNYEQELIMNAQKIPVLIMNPKLTQVGGSFMRH